MTKQRNPLLLEGVLQRAVTDCGGPATVADELDLSEQSVRDWLRTDEKRCRPTYEQVRRLSRLTPVFAEDLAERCGMRLVPFDQDDATAECLMMPMADLSKEFGDVIASITSALADGKVEGHEKLHALGELQHLADATRRLMVKLNGGD
jgi:hypothetical protein